MSYTSRLCPKRGYLFQASGIWKGRDFTRCSIWKGREIYHLSLLKGPKGLTDEFYGFTKSRKRSIFVIANDINDGAFIQQLKGMQSSKQGMWKEYHLSIEGIQKGYLFRDKWYIKGSGVGPRGGAPQNKHLSFVEYSPPPTLRALDACRKGAI